MAKTLLKFIKYNKHFIIAGVGCLTAILLIFVGWIILYRITLRSQKNHMLNQIMNDARIDIIDAMRSYRNWLIAIKKDILGPFVDNVINYEHTDDSLAERFVEFQKRLCPESGEITYHRWFFKLKEYELLFPNTVKCRDELMRRDREIEASLRELVKGIKEDIIESDTFDLGEKISNQVQQDLKVLDEQEALVEDFIFSFQNYFFGKLTGSEVPTREPERYSRPRIILDKEENFILVDNKNISSTTPPSP